MKRRLLAVMMCLAMTVVMAAGCGGKKEAETTKTTEKESEVTEVTEITADNVKDSMKGVTLKVGTSGLFVPLHLWFRHFMVIMLFPNFWE